MRNYRLEGREPVPVDDLMEWARWFEAADRRVDRTEIVPGIYVSTIFLGTDHNWSDVGPPLLFETMCFNDYDEVAIGRDTFGRYATWEEAKAGHASAVAELKELLSGKVGAGSTTGGESAGD